jgi:hypothetical protein
MARETGSTRTQNSPPRHGPGLRTSVSVSSRVTPVLYMMGDAQACLSSIRAANAQCLHSLSYPQTYSMSTRKRPFEFPPNTDRQKVSRIKVESEAQSQGLERDHNAFGAPSASRNRKRKPETESTGVAPLTKKLRSSPPNPEDRANCTFIFRLI